MLVAHRYVEARELQLTLQNPLFGVMGLKGPHAREKPHGFRDFRSQQQQQKKQWQSLNRLQH